MSLSNKFVTLCVIAVAVLGVRLSSAEAALFFERYNHPALWKVENADSTVYIFGSHHVLKSGTRWVPRAFDTVMDEVDEFVFEVEPTEERMPDAQAFIDGSGYLPDGISLRNMLNDETRDSLQVLARRLRIDTDEMDRQRPWLALLTLSSAFYGQRDYSVEYGADVRILSYATWLEKPVRYLETPRQQLEYFAEAMEGAPVEGFEKIITNLHEEPDAIIENIRDWREGDVEATAMRLHAFFEHNPEAMRILLDDRNVSWAAQVEEMLSQGKTYFVTVGVGHLGGPGSVIDLLCKKGLNVERIPTEFEEVPPACG
jgi:uncharacterized protein YbaP (TraB family)